MNRRTFSTLALSSSAAFISSARAAEAPRIRIGQIGTGHAHAAGQLETLRNCAAFDVVGVVEPDEALRKKVQGSKEYAGLPWMTEEQLLNTPGIQAVSVETDVAHLLEHAERVAKAGLHLHLDKPAGEDLQKFKSILDTLSANKRLLKMGYMLRYNPCFVFLIDAVRSGMLGEVFTVHAEMSKKLSEADRTRMLPYKGGSMFELGCHLIDSVLRILGKPQAITPYIQATRPDGYKDNMLAVLQYPLATATVVSSMVEVEGGARRQFSVCGEKGSIEIYPLEGSSLRLMLDAPHRTYRKGVQTIKFDATPRYAPDWEAFAKAIRGELTWEFTPEHDYTVQETVMKAAGML